MAETRALPDSDAPPPPRWAAAWKRAATRWRAMTDAWGAETDRADAVARALARRVSEVEAERDTAAAEVLNLRAERATLLDAYRIEQELRRESEQWAAHLRRELDQVAACLPGALAGPAPDVPDAVRDALAFLYDARESDSRAWHTVADYVWPETHRPPATEVPDA